MTLETKTNLRPETIKKLQELIQINLDSRAGFQQASHETEDLTLSALFHSMASQRDEQIHELSRIVEWNQEEPNREGSYAAVVHRGWMVIRELISSNDPYAILVEVERGEDQIKRAYESVLKETAGSAVNDVLMRQYRQVKASHDRIHTLCDELRH